MKYKELEPAGADRKDWDKLEPLFDDHTWSIEPKLDGWRFLMHLGNRLPRMYLTGRRVSVQTGRLSEKGECAPNLEPTKLKIGYTVIDGEVMPPHGCGFRDLAGIMNVEPQKAHERIEEIGYPEYHAFDLLFFDGRDVRNEPQSWRYNTLHKLIWALWPNHPHVFGVEGFVKKKLQRYEEWVADGGEGGILKNGAAPYGKGWVKVKRYSTLDVIITGFTDAKKGKTGKYEGQIGAAVVSVYAGGKIVEVGQVSGMDDATRLDMSEKPKAYIGKVVEIAAQELAKDRLRHPRFKRMRPDADPKKCQYAKLLKDLKVSKNEKA